MKVVEHYKEFPKYHGELTKYGIRAFMTCFDEVIQAMIKRGVDPTLPILTELKKSLVSSEPTQ